MVDAGDYVSGADVSWSQLAAGLFASWLLAGLTGLIETFQAFVDGLLGLLESGALSVAGLWTRAVPIITTGYDLATAEYEEAVALIGPFAPAISALVVVGMLWIASEVFERVGV